MACSTSSVTVEAASNSGVNGTCISTPTIIQYPKVPVRDDGRWMALGNIVGALVGKFANQSKLNQASAAENEWRNLNDNLKATGLAERDRTTELRNKAALADNAYDVGATRNLGLSTTEQAYADRLKDCDNSLYERLCQLAACGYAPDYAGIATRAKADASALVTAKKRELVRDSTRYNTCMTASMCNDLNTAEVTAALTATTIAREAEKQAAWKYKFDTVLSVATTVENTRVNRAKLAAEYDNTYLNATANRYNWHTKDAETSMRLGLDMLSSAGQNYAWLAESLRRSAEKDTGNFASLGALILPLIVNWNTATKVEDC